MPSKVTEDTIRILPDHMLQDLVERYQESEGFLWELAVNELGRRQQARA